MPLDDEVKNTHIYLEDGDTPGDYSHSKLQSVLSQDIGRVTSRDQIIDPYALVDSRFYKQNRRGRALYKSDLDQAKLYAERQEAAYKEWYESPEQAALRERDAGRNPNLIDGQLGSHESGQPMMPEGSPTDGLPTNGEIASQVASTAAAVIGTVVSSAASLIALPATIAAATASATQAFSGAKAAQNAADLTAAQAQGQQIANIAAFEKGVYGAAAANLADSTAAAVEAGQSFDFDAWLADESNTAGIFESFAPPGITRDNVQYGNAYKRAISNIQKHKGASYGINSAAAQGQSTFAKALSDPYFNQDLLLQIGILEPMMNYVESVRLLGLDYQTKLMEIKGNYMDNLDVSAIAGEQNAKSKYYSDYFNGFEGDEVALYEFTLKKAQALQEFYSEQIDQHNWDIWKKSPDTTNGASAAFLVMGDFRSDAKGWMSNYFINNVLNGFQPGIGDSADPLIAPSVGTSGVQVGSGSLPSGLSDGSYYDGKSWYEHSKNKFGFTPHF